MSTEVARIITVSQIVDGEEICYCGESAVLLVDTEPDSEPGYVCHAHYSDWALLAAGTVDSLFGPGRREPA
jgi:hypothetical protein